MSGAATIDSERPLAEIGLDSLSVLLLRGRLIAEFGPVAALPVVTFLGGATVAGLASAICDRAGTAAPVPGASVAALKAAGSRVPVVLVPPIMRTAFRFTGLADQLDGHPVYGLTPAGLDGRSAPHDSIERMAAAHIQELRAAVPGGSYVVAGACFGGLVAWEMAQQLTDRGVAVPLLVLLDVDPLPAQPQSRRQQYEDAVGAAAEWLRAKRQRLAQHRRHRTLRKWAAARLTGRSTGVEIRLEEVVRTHWAAQLRYRARPFCGRVLIVFSEEKAPKSARDTDRWRRVVNGALDIVTMPGTTHVEILSDPYTPRLGGVIRQRLDALYP
jgi:acetoacetyl-CoA synthetase